MISSLSYAVDSLDSASQTGLDQTIQLLNDKNLREKAAQETQSSAAAHNEVKKLGGESTQNAIYNLSGDILKKLVNETGGDPAKLQELMLQAQKDPEAFAKKLDTNQVNKLRGIASEVEKDKKSDK